MAKAKGNKPDVVKKGLSRRNLLIGAGALAIGGAGVYIAATALRPTVREYGYEVVHRYPHDRDAFTQGLVYFGDNILYEGTGGFDGESSLRKVQLSSGDRLQKRDLPDRDFFGEGIALWQDTIYQLTWQNHVVYVYDRESFEVLRRFENPRDGWGLTHDGQQLIMSSNGSSTLTFHDPATFRVERELTVRDGQTEIKDLNELEYIEGEIYANVWHTSRIARISPQSGEVLSWLNLTGLRPSPAPLDPEGVLNGIAYDPQGKRLFVTGKWWSQLFEIRQVPRT